MQELDYTFVTCKRRIEEGEKRKRELVSDVDEEGVEKLVDEQIKTVGGSKVVFRRIDRQLKLGIIDFSLLSEYCQLYSWRRSFFDKNLPVLKGAWFTDSFCRDVITYQITMNFDQILQILVCSRKIEIDQHPTGLFLSSDGVKTRSARYRLDNIQGLFHIREKIIWTGYFLTSKFLPGSNLRFGDIAHMIVELHGLGSKPLESLAMKTVLENELLLDSVSSAVRENGATGFYHPDCDIPDNLTQDGKELFEKLKLIYNELKSVDI